MLRFLIDCKEYAYCYSFFMGARFHFYFFLLFQFLGFCFYLLISYNFCSVIFIRTSPALMGVPSSPLRRLTSLISLLVGGTVWAYLQWGLRMVSMHPHPF